MRVYDWSQMELYNGTNRIFFGLVWFGFYCPWLWRPYKTGPALLRKYKNCTVLSLPGFSVCLLKVK